MVRTIISTVCILFFVGCSKSINDPAAFTQYQDTVVVTITVTQSNIWMRDSLYIVKGFDTIKMARKWDKYNYPAWEEVTTKSTINGVVIDGNTKRTNFASSPEEADSIMRSRIPNK